MRNYRDYAAELGFGDEKTTTTSALNRPNSAHRSNSQQGFRNNQPSLNEESSGLGKSYGKGQRIGGGEKKLQLGKGKNNKDEEEELSSLSGFTGSDHEGEEEEDHNEIKWSMAPKNKKNKYQESEEEEEEEELENENRDIMLKPQDDLHERFREHDMMRRKGEQEKREREILAGRNAGNFQNIQNSQTMPLKRPQSSHGALRTSTNMSKTFLNSQKENMNHQNRPQTAARPDSYETEERKPVTFKPVYTKTIRETLIQKKVYNYSEKNFKTIAKKSDPVSRINAFKNEWNKTKFLKANQKMKEGRKLNLAERNQNSKPDFIFHKYKSKYNFDQ